jgi:hypothetical protein
VAALVPGGPVEAVIGWRNGHARGKPVWLTEFGWDATTQPQAKEGVFKQWVGVTDTQQARYIVRTFLVLSAMDVDRAYLFFFNDEDKASVHAAAGLTRHFQPKPSFFAMAHLYKSLGEYRFARVVRAAPGDLYVYEFAHARDRTRRIWAVWCPTGAERKTSALLTGVPGRIERAERMPLGPQPAPPVVYAPAGRGSVRVEADESPVYLWLRAG